MKYVSKNEVKTKSIGNQKKNIYLSKNKILYLLTEESRTKEANEK